MGLIGSEARQTARVQRQIDGEGVGGGAINTVGHLIQVDFITGAMLDFYGFRYLPMNDNKNASVEILHSPTVCGGTWANSRDCAANCKQISRRVQTGQQRPEELLHVFIVIGLPTEEC